MHCLQESAGKIFDRVYLCVVFNSRQIGPLIEYTYASSLKIISQPMSH